jgi:hypothetical protein
MGDGPSLEQVLLALQKSFSRVSGATARVTRGEDEPRSIITGPIDFEMTVTGDVASGDDHIRIQNTGALTLKLRGSIQHDIVVEATETGERAAARSTSPAEPDWSGVFPDEAESVAADQPGGEERRATHEGETEGA